MDLLGLNRTEPSAGEDGSQVVRIVGGRDCAEGECPWQVTAGLGGQVAGAGEASAGHCRWLRACRGRSGPEEPGLQRLGLGPLGRHAPHQAEEGL